MAPGQHAVVSRRISVEHVTLPAMDLEMHRRGLHGLSGGASSGIAIAFEIRVLEWKMELVTEAHQLMLQLLHT